jgi:hypothetical protein
MTRILALDLGTACGWATNGDGPVGRFLPKTVTPSASAIFGTFDLRHGRFAGGGVRFVRFRDALQQFTGQVDEVVFEAVQRHAGTAAAHVYGGLLAVLTTWCEDNGTPYDGRSVQGIKKFISGKGNADKQTVIKAVEGRGFRPQNDNEADAIALLLLRLSEIAPRDNPVPLPEGRREVAPEPRLRAARR